MRAKLWGRLDLGKTRLATPTHARPPTMAHGASNQLRENNVCGARDLQMMQHCDLWPPSANRLNLQLVLARRDEST
jgi:hypothetical protein